MSATVLMCGKVFDGPSDDLSDRCAAGGRPLRLHRGSGEATELSANAAVIEAYGIATSSGYHRMAMPRNTMRQAKDCD